MSSVDLSRADELEIAVEMIKRWTTTGDAAETALVPVEVITEVPRLGDGDPEFRLVTRAGHRIEGLRLTDVIEIVRVVGAHGSDRGVHEAMAALAR